MENTPDTQFLAAMILKLNRDEALTDDEMDRLAAIRDHRVGLVNLPNSYTRVTSDAT